MNRSIVLSLAAITCAALSASVSAQPQEPLRKHPLGFFVTSATTTGSGALGGLAGADRICQELAAKVGAGARTWRAYLSIPSLGGEPAVNARDRIGAGPWYNAANVLIAASVEDLHGDALPDSNNVQKMTVLMESGVRNPGFEDKVSTHDILTGSDRRGRALPFSMDASCNGWTDGTDNHKAMLGHADRTGGGGISWNSAHRSLGCSATGGAGKLYCFAADNLTLPPALKDR